MKWLGVWLLSMPVWFGIALWSYFASTSGGYTLSDSEGAAVGAVALFWLTWFGFGIILLGVKLLFF